MKKIASDAFILSDITELVLHEDIIEIEKNAFKDSALKDIYLYDGITSISDECFSGCRLNSLHINACCEPSYSGTYYDAFTDKTDRLMSLKNDKKIVLFSGSSARYGYDSAIIDKSFSGYAVVNMGVFAYTNALPQLKIIEKFVRNDDIILYAPEFDAVWAQFCTTNALDKNFFRMTESDYGLMELLNIGEFAYVFDSFGEYVREKISSEKKDYYVSAADYDDDGNQIGYKTYNEYGDYILKRPNSPRDEMHRIIRADYTVNTVTDDAIESLNRVFETFTEKGVKIYFTYAPYNRSALTERSTEVARRELETRLCEKINIPIISNMENYLYSGIYFYAIDNHLSDDGVKMRTESVISDLKNALSQ